MGALAGRVALVTGGARGGLGHAIARALAGDGATVVVTSRRARSARTRDGLAQMRLDVTDERSVRAVFRALARRFGRLDLLVNNAGIGVFGPAESLSAREFRDVVATNLTGAFLCAREGFRLMRAAGGRIVNLGSVAGAQPLPGGNAAYGASKHGLRGLSAILADEWAAHGVHVTHLTIGAVATEIWRTRPGYDAADMLQPEDVAAAVLDIARKPRHVRVDDVRLVPPRGVL